MTAQRFFRRYFLTGIGLILLFLVANGVMLLGLSMAIDRVSAFRAPLDELAACVQAEGGGYRVRQAEITALLEGSGLPWAMVLDAEGGVVWSWQLPPSLRRDYTAADVARFSRWYLEDYPVLATEWTAGWATGVDPAGAGGACATGALDGLTAGRTVGWAVFWPLLDSSVR